MTTHTVTRCPQCGTSFRITPAQLQSARGAVRCGSCLHIFRAQDHLVKGDATPAPASAKAAAPKAAAPKVAAPKVTAPKPSTTARSTSAPATQAKRPSAPASTGNKPIAPPKPATTATSKPAPRPTQKPAAPAAPVKNKPAQSGLAFDQKQIDNELAADSDDDFLISDDMDQPKKADSAYGEGLSDEFLQLDNPQGSKVSLFDREIRKTEQKVDDTTDESWAMSLLDDDEETEQVRMKPSARENEENSIFKLIEEQATQDRAEADAEANDSHIHTQGFEDEPDEDTYLGAQMYSASPERSALLMNINPEPVEFSWVQDRSHRKWLWSGLVVLALVVLVTQIAWLQFDRLSRMQPYRSAYETICPIVGCRLPDLIDRRQINAAHLIVRNHPSLENALEVNLMLLNNAAFEQPFPDLVLEFSDLQDNVLAVRRFKPDEYLGGELTGRRMMPRNQPIRLTLELVHPGPTAVNYRAYIPD